MPTTLPPTINFTDPTGLSILLIPQNVVVSTTFSLSVSAVRYQTVHTFFRWSTLLQSGTTKKIFESTPRPTRAGTIPLPPMGRQIILTFPPNYKERTGAGRPIKGQLWPRTR